MTYIDYTKFGVHAATFQAMLPSLMDTASKHDEAVDRLYVKEGEISEDILESARKRNRDKNKRVSEINNQITKAQAAINKAKAEAYELVKDDLPKPLTDEERPAVQTQVADLRKAYKTKLAGLHAVVDMLGIDKALIEEIELPTIKENGRKTGGSGSTGHHGVRLRFKEVYINGELAEGKSTNDPNKMVSNFSMAANKLKSELKTQNIGASNIQEQYFGAAGTRDVAKIPNDFTFTFTYVNGEEKKEFEIRAVRN